MSAARCQAAIPVQLGIVWVSGHMFVCVYTMTDGAKQSYPRFMRNIRCASMTATLVLSRSEYGPAVANASPEGFKELYTR